MNLEIHLDEVPHAEPVRRACGERAEELHAEFPQTTRIEVKLQRAGSDHETHIHVTGKDLEVAARARSNDALTSVGDAFEKTRRQLRKHHDKQVLGRRRGTPRVPSR
jgi:ribosome-associated translation inhibitor RaiA